MKKWFALLPVALAIVLEALPWGAVLVFMGPEGKDWRSVCSYFSLTPFGYANFGPLIAAVLSCVVLFLVLLALVSGKRKLWGVAKFLCYFALAASLGPLALGLRFFSWIGAGISLALFLEALILARIVRRTES